MEWARKLCAPFRKPRSLPGMANRTPSPRYDRAPWLLVMRRLVIAAALCGLLPSAYANTVACSGGFILDFADVDQAAGIGFDDPTIVGSSTLGQVRQDTACAVFDYLASVINLGGTTPDILVDLSQNDGTGPLATGSAYYPNSATPGFIGGTLHDHITTGIDPTPAANDFDGRLVVDFGDRTIGATTVSIHSDHTTGSGGQLDLFSILLHESMHALGFSSFIDGNGLSVVGAAYSLFDEYLQDGGGNALINPTGYYFQPTTTADLTGNALRYFGPGNSLPQAVYSPFSFQGGSSLSHFDDLRDGFHYLMRPGTSGGDDRTLTMAEVDVLCNLNYSLYGSACSDHYPIGVDDDNLALNVTTPGVQACVNVLANDSDPDADPVSVDPGSVQIINGGGSVYISSGSLCYTPSANFVGTALLNYRPSDGQRLGNTTRVLVDVQGDFCPDNACSLACNGTFEGGVAGSTPLDFNSMDCGSSRVDNWCSSTPTVGTPDLFIRNGVSAISASFDIPVNFASTLAPAGEVNTWDFPAPGNDRYVGMGYDGINLYSEGVQTQLIKPLTAGSQYNLDFYAYTVRRASFSTVVNGQVMVFLDTVATGPGGTPSVNAQVLGTFTSLNNQWTHIQVPFTASTGGLEHLIIAADYPAPPSSMSYIYIDDVALREVNAVNVVITNTVDDPTPQLGQTVNYTINVCNQDSTPLSNVTIEDVLPAGLTYVSGMSSYPQHLIPGIAGNGCQAVVVTVTVDNTAPANTPLANCAGLLPGGGSMCGSFTGNSQCATITIPTTDIGVAKTISNPSPGPGDTVTYTVTVSNLGTQDATNVVVNDGLPAALSYVGHSITGGTASYDPTTGDLSIPTLPAQTAITLSVTVTIDASACGIVENLASLTGLAETDTNTTNNQATVSIDLGPCPDPNACANPVQTVYTAGTIDNFASVDGPELTSPGAALQAVMSAYNGGIYPNREFDILTSNRVFGHTFAGLPLNLEAATLALHLQARPDIPSNDSINLELPGGVTPFAWGRYIQDLPAALGTWNIGQDAVLTLDLTNLPNADATYTDIVPDMDGNQMLDVYIQDDTAVDYMSLTVTSCPDTTAPVVTAPVDVVAEATSFAGAVIKYPACIAKDDFDPAPRITYSQASGSVFPLGTTAVVCTATDRSGNSGSAAFKVTIKDTTPPKLSVSADIVVAPNRAAGAVVSYPAATAVDAVDPQPALKYSQASKTIFPFGTTKVVVTATDASGNTSTAGFTVTVQGADPASVPCNGLIPTIVGSAGHDVITGTDGPDVIAALGGDDTIHALGGDDVVCGGDGNDVIYGGDGADKLYGEGGDDTIRGEAGDDAIDGGDGNDIMLGMDGNDSLVGGAGNDQLNGNAGDDVLNGGGGNDKLVGSYGDDTLNGEDGDDSLSGLAGNDTLDGGNGKDVCAGGADADKAINCESIAGVP